MELATKQELLLAQNTELEIEVNTKLQDIRQMVLTRMSVVEEHLFSEETEFLTNDEINNILTSSIMMKSKLINSLNKAISLLA